MILNMQEALVSALLKEIQPALYIIGTLTVLCFMAFGGGILKLLAESKKSRDRSIDTSLESLKAAVIENTNQIFKLETRLELSMEKHEKDLNNLGKKLKSFTP